MKFAPGQVVKLKSGGQPMTVVAVYEDAIECIWVGEEGDLFRETIPGVALERSDRRADGERDQAKEPLTAKSEMLGDVDEDEEDDDEENDEEDEDEDDEDDDEEEDDEDEDEDEEVEEDEEEDEIEEDEDEEEDLHAQAGRKDPEPAPPDPRREPATRGRRKRTVPA